MKTYPLYLNGEWAETGSPIEVTNPATGETVAGVYTVTRVQVAQAIDDAHLAFHDWRKRPGLERGRYLQAVADELESRADEIARTITLENGKPLAQGRGELSMSVDHLRWFAEEARRTYGRIVPNTMEGKRHLVIKSPMGVVGAISPWNFPLVLACRKVAPALAAGCTVVHKPASATPLCSLAFAECMKAADVPRGVYQLVLGPSQAIGQEFLENPRCRKITFTGSTEVGKMLIAGAASTVKPLSLELGGQAPVLVFDDVDLDQAVDGVMVSKFRNIGQSCIAANRIYVQKGIYEKFLQRFVEKTRAMKMGNGLEDGVEIGPLIDEAAVTFALRHIDNAVEKGARLLCGGRRPAGFSPGFLEATVLADVPDTAACMQEETFAPVAAFASFESEDEAVERANRTRYGLAAYVFTRDLNRALRLGDVLEAGSLGINDGAPAASHAPFGGIKESGWGRELGTEGLDAFLDTKHMSIGGI